MLIKICTDTWRDIFDFISPTDRRRLALKFNEVKDREFSDLCQKWLHELTKNVCLEELWIDSYRDSKLARLISLAQGGEVPFPEVGMPANITDFEEIEISYLDTSVLNFLRHLQPLFRSAKLVFSFDEESLETMRTALTHLMPLFSGGGIEYIKLNRNYSSSQLLPTIRDNFQAQFLGIKILSMPFITVGIDEFVELYLPWLGTRRTDGQPRMLKIKFGNAPVMQIVHRLRQNFLDTTSGPVNFFICFISHRFEPISDIPESITKNGSGEQLVIRKTVDFWMDENANYLLIGRCPAEVDGQTWIEEMDKKLEEANQSGKRNIYFSNPTIGQIEEAQQQTDGNEVEDDGKEEDADQQPGPSNRI